MMDLAFPLLWLAAIHPLAAASPTPAKNARVAAGCTVKAGATLVVSKSPDSCEYSTVTAALAALPNDGQAYTISIKAGTYNEQISVTRKGKVTLRGETSYANDYSQNKVTISVSKGVLTSAGQDETTPVINSKKISDDSGLALYNINFVNKFPQKTNYAALAADFYGNAMAAYGCSFVGFQDVLLTNKGVQVFSNCYIEGSIDIIWGFSTAYFKQTKLASNTPGGTITAHSRASGTTAGYVFDGCYATYTSSYGSSTGTTYLGRPYNSYSTSVFMNSYLDRHISPAGWSVWTPSNPQTSNVVFAEYNNSGPGSAQKKGGRASFAKTLTASQAAAYSLEKWIGDTSWIDMTAYNYKTSWSF